MNLYGTTIEQMMLDEFGYDPNAKYKVHRETDFECFETIGNCSTLEEAELAAVNDLSSHLNKDITIVIEHVDSKNLSYRLREYNLVKLSSGNLGVFRYERLTHETDFIKELP